MKVRPEKVVVYIERLPTGAQLVIKNKHGGTSRFEISRLAASVLGARYKVLVGDPATIIGSEPEYYE